MADPWANDVLVSRIRPAKKAEGLEPWSNDTPVIASAPPETESAPVEQSQTRNGSLIGDDGKPYTIANTTYAPPDETDEQRISQGYQQDSDGRWFKMVGPREEAKAFTRAAEAQKPEWQQKLGAFGQAAAEQLPFVDEAAAFTASKLFGGSYDQYRNAEKDLSGFDTEFNRGSQVAGGISGVGASLAAPGAGYVRGAQGLAAVGRAAQVGAGYGALYGLGAGDGSLAERAPGAALGAVTGAVAGGGLQAAGNAIGRIAGISGAGSRAPAPTLQGLQTAKNAAYDAVDNSGAIYSKDQIKGLANEVEGVLKADNLNPLLHPRATAMLRQLKAQGGDMSLTQVDQLRQVIRRDVASSAEKGEQYMGHKMIDSLDQFLDSSAPAEGPEDAAGLATRARDLNTRVRKIEDINDAVDAARLQAGSTGSGGNVNNAIRQKLRGVLTRRNNFTPEESDALEGIIVGTRGQNFLRQVGKLSPEGNGLMMALQTGGAVATGGMSAPLMVGGALAKRAADRQTITAVERLVADIARGAEGVPVEDQVAARALLKLKGLSATSSNALSTYRAAISRLAAQAVAGNDNALRPAQAAASPEETQPTAD